MKWSSHFLDITLAQYELRGGSPAIAGFFGRTQTISVIDGQLLMNAIPLIPQSETKFDSTAAPVEFFMDSHGAVTHFMLTANDGEGGMIANPENPIRNNPQAPHRKRFFTLCLAQTALALRYAGTKTPRPAVPELSAPGSWA